MSTLMRVIRLAYTFLVRTDKGATARAVRAGCSGGGGITLTLSHDGLTGVCILWFSAMNHSCGNVIPNAAKRSEESQILVLSAKLRNWKHIMTMAQHFRFLAALGMTGRRGPDRSCNPILPTPVSPRRERGAVGYPASSRVDCFPSGRWTRWAAWYMEGCGGRSKVLPVRRSSMVRIWILG